MLFWLIAAATIHSQSTVSVVIHRQFFPHYLLLEMPMSRNQQSIAFCPLLSFLTCIHEEGGWYLAHHFKSSQFKIYRSMDQNRKPRDKSTSIWSPYLRQRRQGYTMEKR